MEKRVGKKLITVLLALFAVVSIGHASPVDSLQAMKVARMFVPGSPSDGHAKIRTGIEEAAIVYVHKMSDGKRAAFYVVNVGDSFVIVSGDDVTHQVLGYGPNKISLDAKNGSVQLPSHVKDFFDDLAQQIEVAAEARGSGPLSGDRGKVQSVSPTRGTRGLPNSVGPLLKTTWDQGQYYNALCPEDANGPGGHVWAGCIATAMAQIIKYWSYSSKGHGQHSYDSNYGRLSVDYANASWNFNRMPSALSASSTSAEINAVASLMYQCGVAVNMEYSPEESASYDVDARAALVNFFCFSPDLSFAEKASFTNDQWNDLLRENIAANHPILYSGKSGNSGHAFVCDGYKSGDYFHFNFGWGGLFDGWFLTSAIDVNNSNFNSSQSALIDIVPDENCNVILGQMTGHSTFTVDAPVEFYNIMGHNAYQHINYSNTCNNTVTFIPATSSKQLVADIMEFEDQQVTIFDGTDTDVRLRYLEGGGENDLSQVVSSANALTLNYSGNMYYTGFKICLSQDTGLRMVSNITSVVNLTAVNLTWTENGNATEWEVEYGLKGFNLGTGTLYHATTNNVTFENLKKFTEYDFYVRAVSGTQRSLWNKTTLMIEAPYWQEVITSEPEGYVVNEETHTVEISTAEGLAWWAVNDTPYPAYLTADIDLGQYKWRPISWGNSLNGQGHIISNAYIIESGSDAGLYGECSGSSTISDLGIANFHVKGNSNRTGGLCGRLDKATIRNCYAVDCIVDGGDYTGGLVGETDYGTVENCYVNAYVMGARWASLLIGHSYNGTVSNCYAAGSFKQRAYCYNGGIVAYANDSKVNNCYSVAMPMGVVGFTGNSLIADTATFVRADAGFTLLTPAVFDEENVNDLLTALNKGVSQINDGDLNTWKADAMNVNEGYPVFSSKHVVLCPNVTDVTIRNVKAGSGVDVSVDWTENGSATQWQIRYRRHDIENAPYTYVSTTTNPTMVHGIPVGQVYDFSMRAIDNGGQKSGWSENQYIVVDKIYWTDVVTKKPAGYVEDAAGNVAISTAEGLAWLSVKVNGLYNQTPVSFAGKTVTLTADINLDGCRWYPIGGYINGNWVPFAGTFDGQNHSISNIYVNDGFSCKGLFGYVNGGSMKNVNMVGGSVASIFSQAGKDGMSASSSAIGGLVGYATYCQEINNCHSSVNVYGNANVGSLCGQLETSSTEEETVVSNCSASGIVTGREACAGLIGRIYGQVVIRNCFATGDVKLSSKGANPWYRGGLIGHSFYCTINNCHATGKVDRDPQNSAYVAKLVGCPQESSMRYLYGLGDVNTDMDLVGYEIDNLSDSRQFHHQAGENALSAPVAVGGKEYSDLTEALNAWVTTQNDTELMTWTLNGETGYPVFGDYLETSCPNPAALVVSNASMAGNATIKTRLSWTQKGQPKSWEVLYVAAEHDISEGVIVPVTSNPCVLTDIPVGKPLDFYVRAVNSETEKSYWCKSVKFIHDKLHWTEVVTSQPEGYREDENDNVFISSAEGLAWMSSVANGLNGVERSEYNGKTVFIMADIDLSAYRWTPIGFTNEIYLGNCVIFGNNHVISGLYCNDLADYMGLIGCWNSGMVSNLSISKCNVSGENQVGALVGQGAIDILNCSVSGNVNGLYCVGGITGRHSHQTIRNSCFVGKVAARYDITKVNTFAGSVGGICGGADHDQVVNCYVVSEISDAARYTGIITGSGFEPTFVGNCYYKYYETTLPITGDCNTANNSSFTISGNKCTLSTPSYVSGDFCSDLTGALTGWVDDNNANGEYRHWVDDEENQNSSYPVFNPECYSLTYMLNDEVYKVSMLESGAPIMAEAAPTKEGFVFYGWSDIPETMPAHDVVITGTGYLKGDANYDGKVDAVDIVYAVAFIKDGTKLSGFNEKAADADDNGKVDENDIIAIKNIIMR